MSARQGSRCGCSIGFRARGCSEAGEAGEAAAAQLQMPSQRGGKAAAIATLEGGGTNCVVVERGQRLADGFKNNLKIE